MIKDPYGRPLTGLRISVTQRCNLDCFYCHLEGEMRKRITVDMTPGEIEVIGKIASSFGISKIKLTGGEPLIRRDIVDIVERLNGIVGIKEISMTTNGTLIKGVAIDLREAGLSRVNISMDTLKPEVYRRITGFNLLEEVIVGVKEAVEAGFSPVKLNMVVMKGLNHNEVWDMIEFVRENGLILQLIELESPSAEADEIYRTFHYDLSNIENELQKKAEKIIIREMHHRKKYILPEDVEVEIVKPMHNTEFCKYCNRLRVTSDGKLKPCLFRNDNLVNFIGPLRSGAPDNLLKKIFLKAVEKRKPFFA